jgi:GxxExxY protein
MAVNVIYKGERLANQRLDMVVDGKVVVETKSSLDLHKTALRQLYNYLKATNMEVGLLLHFGEKAAFYRVIRSSPKKEPTDLEKSAESL